MADSGTAPAPAREARSLGQRINRYRNLVHQGAMEFAVRPVADYPPSKYYVSFSDGAPVFRRPGKPGHVEITEETLADLASQRRIGPLDLIFSESSCIDLKFSLPDGLIPELRAIIDNEIQFRSPFSDDASLWFWQADELPGHKWQARAAVTLKAPVEGILTQLRAHGLQIGVVRREAEHTHFAALPVWAGHPVPEKKGWFGRMPALLRFSVLGAILFCGAAVGLTIKNGLDQSALSSAAAQARADISAQAQARAGQRQLDRSVATSFDKLALAGVLSTQLPDGVWLDQLIIDDDTVTLIGNAPSAAEITRILAEVPGLSDIRFASPVTRDNSQSLERFRIAATLTPAET